MFLVMATLALPAISVKAFAATVIATLECGNSVTIILKNVAYTTDLLTYLIANGNLVLEAVKPTLAGMVLGWVPFKFVSDSPDLHSRWLLLLKIEFSSIVHFCFNISQKQPS
jgi:hypothetical protein